MRAVTKKCKKRQEIGTYNKELEEHENIKRP